MNIIAYKKTKDFHRFPNFVDVLAAFFALRWVWVTYTDSLSIIGTVIIDIIKNKTDMFTSLGFSN